MILNDKKLDKVSKVSPDFEIIINNVLFKICFFLKLISLFSSRLSKK